MPPAPSTGGVSGSGGSTSIAVTFPDGQTVIVSSSVLVYTKIAAGPAYSILVAGTPGSPTYTYNCSSAAEMSFLMKSINDAISAGIQTIGLQALLPTPASGDLDALNPTGGTVMGGTTVVFTIATKPDNGNPQAGNHLLKSFTPNCVVLIGGRKCPYVQFVNAYTLYLVTPPGTTTAAADLDYSDLKGTIHVAGAFTYS